MPTYITQGRYTRDAIKGMIVRPEDRADAVARLLTKVGGRLIAYYVTFGEFDFLCIGEAPNDVQMAAALFAAGSGGDADRADEIDVERQVRPVLLDRPARDDAHLAEIDRVVDLRPRQLLVAVLGLRATHGRPPAVISTPRPGTSARTPRPA